MPGGGETTSLAASPEPSPYTPNIPHKHFPSPHDTQICTILPLQPPYTLMDLTSSLTFFSEPISDSEGLLGISNAPFLPHLPESDYFADSESEVPNP